MLPSSFSVPDHIQRWRNLDGKECMSATISELLDKIQHQRGGMNFFILAFELKTQISGPNFLC